MTFNNEIVAGNVLVREAIQSENYQAGTTGWSINSDGTAEFSDLTIRSSDGSGNTVEIANGEFIAKDVDGDVRVKLNFNGLTFWNDLNDIGAEIKLDNTGVQTGFYARAYTFPFNTYALLQGDSLAFGSIGADLFTPGYLQLDTHATDYVAMELSSGRQANGDTRAVLRAEDDTTTGEASVQVYGDGSQEANFYFEGNIRRGFPGGYVDQGQGLKNYTNVQASTALAAVETIGITSGNVTFVVGRAYRATLHYQGSGNTAGDEIGFKMHRTNIAGTSLFDTLRTHRLNAAGAIVNGESSQIITNQTGSDLTTVIVGTVYRAAGAGNVQMFANAANPVWLMVEDIGEAADYPNARAL